MKNFLLLIFFFTGIQVTVGQERGALDQRKAVEIAERFVAANGYTDAAVSRNRTFYLEPGENASDLGTILTARFDSIESRAVIALIKTQGSSSFWSVQFLFRDDRKVENGYDLGREVRSAWMDPGFG